MERTALSCYLSKANLLSYQSLSKHVCNNKMSDPLMKTLPYSQRGVTYLLASTLKYIISQTFLRKTWGSVFHRRKSTVKFPLWPDLTHKARLYTSHRKVLVILHSDIHGDMSLYKIDWSTRFISLKLIQTIRCSHIEHV